MKTTVDIPEALYKKVKIRAVKTGQSFKSILISSLEHEMEKPPRAMEEKPYWGNRKLTPEFAALQKRGAFAPKPGDRNITDLISEDRDGH